jgi:hypothetical protein
MTAQRNSKSYLSIKKILIYIKQNPIETTQHNLNLEGLGTNSYHHGLSKGTEIFEGNNNTYYLFILYNMIYRATTRAWLRMYAWYIWHGHVTVKSGGPFMLLHEIMWLNNHSTTYMP